MSSETETAENKDGPSKNELKKMAKKAEKAAKKQQARGGGGGGAPAAPSGATPPPAPASSGRRLAGGVQIDGLLAVTDGARDATVLKVVWACKLHGVELAASKSTTTSSSSLWNHHPTLLIPSEVGDDNKEGSVRVGGGGNAMAMAVAKMGSCSGCLRDVEAEKEGSKKRPKLDLLDWLRADEWCEWERNVLRPIVCGNSQDVNDNNNNKKKLEAALQHLEAALERASGPHLLGAATGDSVADVCVLSTLFQTKDGIINMPSAVARYREAHTSTWDSIRTAAEDLIVSSKKGASTGMDVMDANEASLLKVLDGLFRGVARDLFGDDLSAAALPPSKLVVTKCQNAKQGDFQCTAAMAVFAALKKKGNNSQYRSPQEVAAAIVEGVGHDHPAVMELKVFGPGFVLCRLTDGFLRRRVRDMVATGKLPIRPVPKKLTCVVDFSSPNIAKEMHVGHLRSTIIGEAVCRILEFVGYDVHRVNHVGDWGTQFGMLIQYLKEEYPDVGREGTGGELPNITDLTEFYKKAKERFDESPEFKKTSQTNVVKLQGGDDECLRIWNMLCDVSRREFQKVYDRLDVKCEEFGESFYNDKIPATVEEFDKAGRLRIEEGGAKCVFLEGIKVPLMLQKSDGGYGYDSTDMAALKFRLKQLQADRLIYITDFSQADHFKMVFQAGRDIGWLDRDQKLQHIGFGTVQGEDGKRFKTRSGDTVRLVDLLDEAVGRMEASLKDRIGENKANITLDEVHEVAEAIGYGAVKYYDLRRNPTSNYKFSYDQMLDTKGDTAVYLLYARVRLESICAKAANEHAVNVQELVRELRDTGGETGDDNAIALDHPSERNLAVHLLMFADTMVLTLDDLFPYHICEYVYKLSIAATDFVTQCKVLGSPEIRSRLLLCHATVQAMRQSFDLLGIRHVKRI